MHHNAGRQQHVSRAVGTHAVPLSPVVRRSDNPKRRMIGAQARLLQGRVQNLMSLVNFLTPIAQGRSRATPVGAYRHTPYHFANSIKFCPHPRADQLPCAGGWYTIAPH